ASLGEIPKKSGSNSSTPLMNAPHFRLLAPCSSCSFPDNDRQSQRSLGISTMLSLPDLRFSQNSSRSSAPGKRPLMPMTAIATAPLSFASACSAPAPFSAFAANGVLLRFRPSLVVWKLAWNSLPNGLSLGQGLKVEMFSSGFDTTSQSFGRFAPSRLHANVAPSYT